MENTITGAQEAPILDNAMRQMAQDMEARGLGAIIWNLREAGFHYLPVVTIPGKKENRNVRVTGLIREGDKLYAIEEGLKEAEITNFYTQGVDVPPVVVTLTPILAEEELPAPEGNSFYTREGSTEEWLAIADCYFEALNEVNP